MMKQVNESNQSTVFPDEIPAPERASTTGNTASFNWRTILWIALVAVMAVGIVGIKIPVVSLVGSYTGQIVFNVLAGKASRFGLFILLLPLIGYAVGYWRGYKKED